MEEHAPRPIWSEENTPIPRRASAVLHLICDNCTAAQLDRVPELPTGAYSDKNGTPGGLETKSGR